MNNAEWCIKNNIKFSWLNVRCAGWEQNTYIVSTPSNCYFDVIQTNGTVNKCDVLAAWLDSEHKDKPILDDVEKQYLKAVIRPFRSKVVSIKKCSTIDGYYYLYLHIKSSYGNNDCMIFPFFPSDAPMYVGMEANKNYTLKELGL